MKVNVAGRKFEKVSDFDDLTTEQVEYLINEWSPTLNLAVEAYNGRTRAEDDYKEYSLVQVIQRIHSPNIGVVGVDGEPGIVCPVSPKERVEIELQELKEKIKNLKNFIGSNSKDKLSSEVQFLLVTQLKTMQAYSNLLTRRLEIWRD